MIERSLDVRIYDGTFSAGGTALSLAFLLQPTSPQGDGTVWTLNTAAVTATVTSQAVPATGLYRGSSSGAVGGLVNLVVSFTQYSSAPVSAYFTASADLVQKT